ncbi:hypothetical protein HYPSUDRAFT_40431 [Hypholoma sublateritium FD-334 SS-4]|uniref:Methyltransferase domain-containing protein n=1 Tax=Hypholoma sublateritium (strain FD-334 SS-4) TaxID=945553 RepID=A0A0D2MH23_HYPSF|nr:hypothetical protein HYPSUDRAFT_40431 [Hypholoma sublateritium FD-334 SS-4]
MAQDHYFADPALKSPLNPDFYNLRQDEREFFKKLTGIADDDALKAHVITIQTKAYELYSYPCILSFSFTQLKIAKIPGYRKALKLLEQRESPILLDMGCCFGNDIRKAVVDGWPVENVIASDINPVFWEYGHELFKSNPQTFPAAFVAGNIFDPAFLAPRDSKAIITAGGEMSTTVAQIPPLKNLRSLTPLQGKISAIYSASFFHLFDQQTQLQVARRLSSLLSPEKGSVIFGQHAGDSTQGYKRGPISIRNFPTEMSSKAMTFCHSPESWERMWIEDVFGGEDGKGADRIKVDSNLFELQRPDLEGMQFWMLNWCVTRL